jgi:hypothetical protein
VDEDELGATPEYLDHVAAELDAHWMALASESDAPR